MRILGIDPGVTRHGWALVDTGVDPHYVIDCGHTELTQFLPPPADHVIVERPFYQGAARTQGTILDTAFWAGYFHGTLKARVMSPVDWKRALWGKGSGITEAQVQEFALCNVSGIPRLPKSKLVHIYDAICLALALDKTIRCAISNG